MCLFNSKLKCFSFLSQVRQYINEAYEYHIKSKNNLALEKKSVLGEYIDNMDKHNLTIDDLIGTMAELLIGGIDTVIDLRIE